ncbi:GDSL-like Lipase/Acylhydrolase family protein [Hydrogenophaga sp. RAC07]|uniref:GDSL-type esterase/lipase family protein n=1 Tax=Hydrogenophaga sp. RAC07 TaxID=1842537 RepID=UPI00083CDC47|nr:GDSL-type esterase/lipase family protein [Hydrogenophaga sp. RAC07]AOF86821.1 GDSL-like Lipase/Acylhydrolase family protein [Hydrogenophaga sp. RAC07]
MKRRALLLAAALLPASLWAQSSATEQRWKKELDAFAAADRQQMPPPGGVLFVGSSSIRFWTALETTFADQAVVIKRGFGGSRLSESADLVHRLVLPYQPRLVVLYAGENDIHEGSTPLELLGHFQRFVQQVQGALPSTRVAFMAIKPSPSRVAFMATMREANLLIQTHVLQHDNLDYIDVHTAMLDNDGRPRPELFVRDQLHLSAEGYGLWRQIVSAHLRP